MGLEISYRLIDKPKSRRVWQFSVKGFFDQNLEYMPEINAWCQERFGEPEHDKRWLSGGRSFFFYEDDDAFEFRIRWC